MVWFPYWSVTFLFNYISIITNSLLKKKKLQILRRTWDFTNIFHVPFCFGFWYFDNIQWTYEGHNYIGFIILHVVCSTSSSRWFHSATYVSAALFIKDCLRITKWSIISYCKMKSVTGYFDYSCSCSLPKFQHPWLLTLW